MKKTQTTAERAKRMRTRGIEKKRRRTMGSMELPTKQGDGFSIPEIVAGRARFDPFVPRGESVLL